MSARFIRSAPFDAFLETIEVEVKWATSEGVNELVLACNQCGEALCDIEAEDTLRVLVNTAMVHDDECPARQPEDGA